MTENVLKISLPGFALVFLLVILYWNSFKKFGIIDKIEFNERHYYNRLKRLHSIYLIIMIIFFLMIFLYSFFTEIYSLFLPIDALDHPIINGIGFILLKFALGWVIITQIKLDNRIYRYSLDVNNLSLMAMVFKAEKNLIKGLLIMFAGVVITISNLIGIFLCLLALLYYFFSNRKLKHSRFII
ncbi:MAG TPA: hypothetical protein VGQ09_04855 [Chitinophagaceae bacterium]|jgi:hypothetical protein|nr:hypothetical protein [Chitinophagaceae bacterium]